MTRAQLEAVYNELVESLDSTNDAAADDDCGRADDRFILELDDDGSGRVYLSGPEFTGPDGQQQGNIRGEEHIFRDCDGLVDALMDLGFDFEQESDA